MKIRTIIAAVIFLSLCAVKLFLPTKAAEIRDSIIPAISNEPNYRQDMIALGRTLSGAGNSIYTLENGIKKDVEGEKIQSASPSPRPSFDAAAADGFVLSDMVNQNLSGFKSPEISPSVSPDAQASLMSSPSVQTSPKVSPETEIKSTTPSPSAQVKAAETTAPKTTPSAFVAPEAAPVETSTPESKLAAKLEAFLNEEATFSDYKIPDNVSCTAPVLPFKYTSPAKSAVSSTFGYRVHPIYNDVRFHYGTDFAVVDGDAILSFADGKVISVQEIKGYGMTVMLDHGNGYTTLYAHCGQVKVKYGDKVKRGSTIALAGHSGLVTGPNLHFELMHSGKYLDPEFYL